MAMIEKMSNARIVVHAFLALYAVILAYIIGGLLFRYNVPVDLFFGLSFALLLFALVQAIYEIGIARTLVFFAITSTVGFAVEVLGTSTGIPFGKYTYTNFLGPKVLGVPEVVPLIWFVIVYICFSQSFGIIGYPESSSKSIRSRLFIPIIALTAFGIMAWDVIVDPMFTSYGYWIWNKSDQGPKLYSVPLTNFAGWFLVSFAMLLFIFGAFRLKGGEIVKRENAVDCRIAYALLFLDGAVANATLGNYLAIALGALSMLGFLLVSRFLSLKLKSKRVESSSEQVA